MSFRSSDRPRLPISIRTVPALVLAILPASTLTGAASAQISENPSVLSLLPVEQSLSIGDEVSGRFAATAFEHSGQLVQAYAFEAPQGVPVTIDVISVAFDAYVYLLGPDGQEIESDDDSGGSCNARISTFTPEAGRYLIVAGSLTGETGDFTLRVGDRQLPEEPGACGEDGYDGYEVGLLAMMNDAEPVQAVSMGDVVAGSLEMGDPEFADGSKMKVYELLGTPGQTVVIDLASEAFDALLMVLDPRGEEYVSDDDSGGACNSRLELTLDMQPHKIVVTSITSEGTGEFTLSIREEWGPEASGGCFGRG